MTILQADPDISILVPLLVIVVALAIAATLRWRSNKRSTGSGFPETMRALGRAAERAADRAPDREIRFTEKELVADDLWRTLAAIPNEEDRVRWIVGEPYERAEVTDEPTGGITVRVWYSEKEAT